MTAMAERAAMPQQRRPGPLPWVPPPRSSAARGPDQRFRVLMVCTGNICRSPAAELLLRHLLIGRLGGREAGRVQVSSAGVAAVVGSGMHPLSRAALEPWGLGSRAEAFRARQLDDAVVGGVDLVLGANVRHRSSVLERYPHLLDRTFALRELARLAPAVDARALPSDPVLRGRALVGAARALRGTVPAADDRIPDPMGGPEHVHRHAVWLVFDAVRVVADLLAPRAGAGQGR